MDNEKFITCWKVSRSNLDELKKLVGWLNWAAGVIDVNEDKELFISHKPGWSELIFEMGEVQIDPDEGSDFTGERYIFNAHARLYEKDGERFVCPCPECKAKREQKTMEETQPEEFGEGPIGGYYCPGCDAIFADNDGEKEPEPLYECASCGTTFTRSGSLTGDNHQCPDCGKFGAKISPMGCPECQQGELESIGLYQCDVCQELFLRESELQEHKETHNP